MFRLASAPLYDASNTKQITKKINILPYAIESDQEGPSLITTYSDYDR